MLKEVPTIKTEFTIKEFITSMVLVWKEMYGDFPQKKNLAVVFAQWSLETGQGKFCWNWNIGNVKARDVAGETIEYMALSGVWEIVNGKKIILDKTDPGSWFRSFNSLTDGVKFHFNFLKNKRYKIAWTAVEEGDPKKFSHLLRQQGYYTAPEEHYTKAVQSYYNNFMNGKTFDLVIKEIQDADKIPEPVIFPNFPEPEQHKVILPPPPVVIQTPQKKTIFQKIMGIFKK